MREKELFCPQYNTWREVAHIMKERDKLLVLLPSDEADALSMSELAGAMGIPERGLRSLVERMRRDGIAVCASDRGYWLPSEDGQRQQDAERTARRLESRARSALETARALREGAAG